MLNDYLNACPLVAILRGVTPEAAVAVAGELIEAGFSIVEVPLNSPDACVSIAALCERFGDSALIGAGTVTDCAQVDRVVEAGGRLIVSPNCDPQVIRHSKALGAASAPGCSTPSEAFAAAQAGADAIKLFPAEMIPPAAIRALRTVLPPLPLLAVGGICAGNMRDYLQAGASGFGLGASLYRADKSSIEIRHSAEQLMAALRAAQTSLASISL
ncbi:2-dehydro-3-deoxy-6-phosphogalactonate aldolase [Microbulbifer taiwanensis]|uniref:2-dehydro-3-deoxy-6-phosphogalactonate aldolase n=1 Tax=Microbulbifer taiwanensis TaxID=986746 RepID=A0ABW1YN36_9GAMM|nr:2-dehydro-3-deoxy-6-phosphogalactonate aldolase [Microbulbifer taiwanensis]